MKIPHLDDFEAIQVFDIPYYSYKTDEFELCIEPCLNGFDVSLYNLNQDLIYPKQCTNLTGTFTSLTAYGAALNIYTRMLLNYDRDKKLQTNRDDGTTRRGQ